MTPFPKRIRTSVRRWAWVPSVLATVTVACVVVAVQAYGPSAPGGTVAGPTPAGPSSAPGTPSPAPARARLPVTLRIPAIDVDAEVTRLGLNQDQTVEVPSDPAAAGWYRMGPPPGQPGSAVILGHVDSSRGPAVFFRLRHLEPGDRVIVHAADGSTSTFRVVRLETYPNEDFPAQEVYAAPGRRRVLNLVTCGGDYDPESGYQANVVVHTRLARSSRAPVRQAGTHQ